MAVRELSAFFPAFEEEGNIERTVSRALHVLDDLGLERFEIVIVDDGSTDGTGPIADVLAQRHANVRAIHHDHNRGYGAALRTGFAETRYEWVFLTDGDGQFDVGEIERLISHTDECGVIIGFRERRADHIGRRINTFLWTHLVRSTLGLRIRDVDCAFKLLRRDVLKQVGQLESQGALISTELLTKIRRIGIPIVEVPVSHYPRLAGEPSGASVRVIVRALAELARLRRRLGREGRVKLEDAR